MHTQVAECSAARLQALIDGDIKRLSIIEMWKHTDCWRLVNFQSTRLPAEPAAQPSQKRSA